MGMVFLIVEGSGPAQVFGSDSVVSGEDSHMLLYILLPSGKIVEAQFHCRFRSKGNNTAVHVFSFS
ncbi:hypothetical protein D3C74_465950 [compost metagenome]